LLIILHSNAHVKIPMQRERLKDREKERKREGEGGRERKRESIDSNRYFHEIAKLGVHASDEKSPH